ncbi:MAG: hypothetical protein ABIO70_09975 [Pseudomonadota bacterium]
MHATFLLTLGGVVQQIFGQDEPQTISISFAAGATSADSMSVDRLLEMVEERLPGAVVTSETARAFNFSILDPDGALFPAEMHAEPQLPKKTEDGYKTGMRFVKYYFR